MRRWFSAPAGPSSCSGSSSSRRPFLLRPLGRAWGVEEQPGPPAAPEAGRGAGAPPTPSAGSWRCRRLVFRLPVARTVGKVASVVSNLPILALGRGRKALRSPRGRAGVPEEGAGGRRRGRAGRGGIEGQNEPRGRATAVPRARRAAREEPGALDLSKVSERLIRKSIVINQVRDGSEEQHPGAQRS